MVQGHKGGPRYVATTWRLLGAFFFSHDDMESISFNGNKIQQELDIIAKTQIRFIAALTVNRLRQQAQADVRQNMKDKFANPSKYTLRSVIYNHFATKDAPWTELELNDFSGSGNAAARYLLPQIRGGPVFKTRFQDKIRDNLTGFNGAYMLPLHESKATKRNAVGRMRPSQYVEVLYGLKAMEAFRASARPGRYRTEGSYVYMPFLGATPGGSRRSSQASPPKPGIYRVVGGKTTRDPDTKVFAQLKQVPTVAPKFSFIESVNSSISKNTERIFRESADRARFS